MVKILATSAALVFLAAQESPRTPDWRAECGTQGANFGSDVASAGDVDGDGFDDVIISAERLNEGTVFIYRGSETGLAAEPFWTATGPYTGSKFGSAVSSAGDVNLDGFDDVIVGAPGYGGSTIDEIRNQGAIYLYLGGPGGLTLAPQSPRPGGTRDLYFGRSIAGAGDVDGDGHPDILAGLPFQAPHGAAALFHADGEGMSADPFWVAQPDRGLHMGSVAANFGTSVAGAGDVNGDGISDIIVGAPAFEDAGNTPNEGGVFVYLGRDGGPSTASHQVLQGNQSGAQFGKSLAPAGEVGGNTPDQTSGRFDDIVIGAPNYYSGTWVGAAYVYFGTASGVDSLSYFQAIGSGTTSFGTTVCGAGDVDGNGYDDIAAGTPSYNNSQGAVWIYFARDGGGLSQSSLRVSRIDGVQTGGSTGFGTTIAGIRDVNRDGGGDILVAAYRYPEQGAGGDNGAVFAYYGDNAAPLVPSGLRQFKLDGETSLDPAAVTDEPGVVLEGDVADPATQRVALQVQIKPLAESFADDDPVFTAPLGTSGDASSVRLTGLPDGTAFKWRARVVDAGGRASPWAHFETDADDETDFSTRSNAPPAVVPGSVTQRVASTGLPIPIGATLVDETTVSFSMEAVDAEIDDVRMEMELRRLEDGAVTAASGPLKSSGSLLSLDLTLGPGAYAWRCRARDAGFGEAGSWIEHGGDGSGADFVLGIRGGSSGMKSCGQSAGTGAGPLLAGGALLLLLAIRR